jgi:hypothetical protein
MTTTDDNDDEVGSSDVKRISTAVRNNKRQARPHMNHFKRLLKKTCPNHAYPIRYKLKDYDMMRSFMTSGSLTWGAELDEVPDSSDMMLFPEENAVITVYGRCPRWEAPH